LSNQEGDSRRTLGSVNEKLPDFKKSFQEYVAEVKSKFVRGDYTEMTFRTPFENFIESLNAEFGLFQEPERKRKLGAPDFQAFRKAVKVGYIETKDIGKNLDDELESEQMRKYKSSIDNIILTNYGRFIAIRKGQTIFDLTLFDPADLQNPTYVIPDKKATEFLKIADTFFGYSLPTIVSAEELAKELARRARLLRDLTREQLEEDVSSSADGQRSSVYDFLQGIRELINEITIGDAADAYAQTITYGLFLARINKKEKLNRETAAFSIPESIAIIRKIFFNMASDLPSNLVWIIDEVLDILNASDIEKVLTEIDERSKKDRDPFSFFYEDFLGQYDPQKRKDLGVYYTPRPVISFIVNSINSILKREFNKNNGFAEDEVTVLDPAAGTGTFLWLVYILSLVELKNKGLSGLIKTKIQNHILRDFYGFEIQITPYIFAHLKLASLLARWFYQFKDNERAQVYLTNTLEPSESHGLMPFMRELNEESRTANFLKQKKRILVVVSNPPYRGESFNKGPWIQSLMKKGYTALDGRKDEGYYQVDGKPLGEKNPKWVSNDYVKFIRFAQWKIESSGEGVIGYITDHGYLDAPTFRGMRRSLMNSFELIYILNLHGSIRKKETLQNVNDENVFDIQEGVAIALFIKNKKLTDKKVFYADLYGTRDFKFSWLDRNTVDTVQWQQLVPSYPQYLFIPFDETAAKYEEYEKYWSINDIFPTNSVGVVTARDDFTIKWSATEVWDVVSKFAKMEDTEAARRIYSLGEDADDWRVAWARQDIVESGPNKEMITPILYRPFDIRYTYYTSRSRGFICRPRTEVMLHMKQDNLGLIFHKREELPVPYSHFFVADKMVEHGCLSSKTTCYLAPLYLYADGKKSSNINPKLIDFLSELYGREPQTEEIFYYIYAVLHSQSYRTEYDGYLRKDVPRVPFTKRISDFEALAQLGKELVHLHLGRVKLPIQTKFDIEGSNVVKISKYSSGRIYINEKQFFGEIPDEIWNMRIGAYQVLDKWLKSRKNRTLTGNEIEQFMVIIEILKKTREYMTAIDSIKILETHES